jgi:hypothetical protein
MFCGRPSLSYVRDTVMAEPIRKPFPMPHHRPRPRPRPPHPVHAGAAGAALWDRSAEPVSPPQAALRASAQAELETESRSRTGAVLLARERRLRAFLQIAIALHIAALVPFLLPSGNAPTLSDALLGTAVLFAGAGVLTLGWASRKGR